MDLRFNKWIKKWKNVTHIKFELHLYALLVWYLSSNKFIFINWINYELVSKLQITKEKTREPKLESDHRWDS